jgi:nucleoside-diphosphate-sugar epimerase
MKIFVTGGTGFIGRYTVKELRERGHRLLILSSEARGERGADLLKGDLADIARWKGRLKKFKPQAAVHLAWEGIPDFSYAQSVKNLNYGLALFAALAEAGCKKIVAMGTGYEYGDRVGKVDEEIHVLPASAVTAAKHALHMLGEEMAKEKGMDFIWLRPFKPYGHGQRAESLISYIMRCVAGNVPLTLKSPLTRGDFVYVGDVARAIADAAARGRGRATYNVGSGKLTSARDIAKMVCEGMGASKEYYKDFLRTAKGKAVGGGYAELGTVRKGIGWRPTTDIRTGIQKTIRDFYENHRNRV